MTQAKKSRPAGAGQASKPKKLLNGGVDPAVGKSTQFKPGQSGNPAGPKPGTRPLRAWIDELMHDDEFEVFLFNPRQGYVPAETGQPPIKAIVKTAIYKAAAGDEKSREWLAKYGYGTKIDVTSNGERISETPKIISVIVARDGDATAQTETS